MYTRYERRNTTFGKSKTSRQVEYDHDVNHGPNIVPTPSMYARVVVTTKLEPCFKLFFLHPKRPFFIPSRSFLNAKILTAIFEPRMRKMSSHKREASVEKGASRGVSKPSEKIKRHLESMERLIRQDGWKVLRKLIASELKPVFTY